MGRRSHGLAGMILLVVTAPLLQGCAWLLMRADGAISSPPPPVVSPIPLPSTSAAPSLAAGELPSPDQLAALLSPDDFTAIGVEGAGPPSYDSGFPGDVYAVYAGRSGADGGIEVDVFADGTADDAAALVGDPGLFALDADVKATMGAERASYMGEQPTNDGTSTYDTLWVQSGRLAAALSIPASERSRDQLIALATLLLTRSAPYQ